MKGHCSFLAVFALLALASILGTSAYDPSPLQDTCVAINDPKTGIFVNGKFCKDPKFVTADDFFFSGLNIPRDPSNPVGSVVTPVNVDQIPGLNTMGISLVRIVFPIGLIHFQQNVGKTNAVAFASLSSQNPGVITIPKAVFGSNPPINPDVLTRAFQLDNNVVKYLQSRFGWKNN
ncbi:germin-like protein subfamily 1 member 20 [Gossypium arboreum]|uniref:germin-like protein subfamily 1 member 20 n=1 Tax=Gossypium arboreum TaxID=29729 RepID=UPI0022F1A642|nr:germin-like protein subfamily 1 member 20 [Gossypium arboreum]